MKILQIVPSLVTGGAEAVCESLSVELQRMGHEVKVVSLYTMETPITQRLEKAGVPILFLNKKAGLDLKCIPALARLIREERPDVIHSHLYVPKYLAAALPSRRIPLFHTIHNTASVDAEKDGAIQRFLFSHKRMIPVSLSEEIRQTVVNFYGIAPDLSPIVRNGVDLSRCLQKIGYQIDGVPKLIHVGRFYEQKNHKGMLEAVKILKDCGFPVMLRFFGDGPLMEDCRAMATKMEIEDCVSFCGLSDWIYPHLQNADAFLLPSLFEGLPISVIEAMGTGLPIIASAVGGVPDILTDKEDSLLISPEPQAIADAIMTLCKDEALREKLGRQALQDSAAFSVETMARQYERLYQKALNEKK